jgi:hypothetical protein
MTKAFKVGDRVSWNSEAGRVSGTISYIPDKPSISTSTDGLRVRTF